MVDVHFIRENPELYRKEIEKRGSDELLRAFDKFLEIDKEWRNLKKNADLLRSERNKISLEINERKKKGLDIKDLVEKAKDIPNKLKELEEREKILEKERYNLLLLLPSPLDSDVPIGGEEKKEILEYVNKPRVYKEWVNEFKERNNTDFIVMEHKPLSHYDLVEMFNLVDMDSASRIAGSRFYIEKDKLVMLDLAIIMHALRFFNSKGFNEVILPPYMIKQEVEEKITHYDTFKEAIFHVKEDDLLLITTSEHSIAAMYMDKNLKEKKRILAWSPAFRREAGSHGKDTKGIFRVKQFHKVELHSITTIDDERNELNFLIETVKDYMKELGLPFRVVKLPSMDMDKRASIQIDIETWFPAQNDYRETHSIASVKDWISRKINIKMNKDYAINLYATGVAVQRMICAILENNYDPEKKVIHIPKVLQEFTNFEEIELKN